MNAINATVYGLFAAALFLLYVPFVLPENSRFDGTRLQLAGGFLLVVVWFAVTAVSLRGS